MEEAMHAPSLQRRNELCLTQKCGSLDICSQGSFNRAGSGLAMLLLLQVVKASDLDCLGKWDWLRVLWNCCGWLLTDCSLIVGWRKACLSGIGDAWVGEDWLIKCCNERPFTYARGPITKSFGRTVSLGCLMESSNKGALLDAWWPSDSCYEGCINVILDSLEACKCFAKVILNDFWVLEQSFALVMRVHINFLCH